VTGADINHKLPGSVKPEGGYSEFICAFEQKFFTMCGCNVTFGPLTHDFDESVIPYTF
jgi:hypothetical protein